MFNTNDGKIKSIENDTLLNKKNNKIDLGQIFQKNDDNTITKNNQENQILNLGEKIGEDIDVDLNNLKNIGLMFENNDGGFKSLDNDTLLNKNRNEIDFTQQFEKNEKNTITKDNQEGQKLNLSRGKYFAERARICFGHFWCAMAQKS